ncbi:hypothetical protein Tco_0613777, partial [Tanacetum coccineum]
MEILLEPTSNKLMVERFYTLAGNPVKEILLKLNLPDHRILKDGGEGALFVISTISTSMSVFLRLTSFKCSNMDLGMTLTLAP